MENLQYIIPLAALLLGWAIGYRKTKAEAENTEIVTVSNAVKIWRELAQDLKNEVDELRTIVDELRVENENLRFEISELKKQRHET